MTSPSGSAGNLGVAAGPSVGHTRFKFLLPLPISNGVVVSEVEVSMSVWDA